MHLKDYQLEASAFLNNKRFNWVAEVSSYCMGLAGETGEVIEPIKKHLYFEKKLDKAAVKKELGDVLWYLSAIATSLGLSLSEVAEENIQKLKERYPNGLAAKPQSDPNDFSYQEELMLKAIAEEPSFKD